MFQTYHLVVAAEMDSFSVEGGRAAISFGNLNLTALFSIDCCSGKCWLVGVPTVGCKCQVWEI